MKKLKFEDELPIAQDRSPGKSREKKPAKASQRPKKEDKSQQKPRESNIQEVKRKKTQQLIFLECSILLLIRRYHECLKILNWTLKSLIAESDSLYRANLLKLKGSVYYM